MALTLGKLKTRLRPIAADSYEKLLAYAAILLLAAVTTALIRGRPHWPEVPTIVWFHVATTGALLIAGVFTFPFGRMLGTWLFA